MAIDQLDAGTVDAVCAEADRLRALCRKEAQSVLPEAIVACAFYEPSTRTSCSFQAAALRLGAKVIAIDAVSSSAAKGESLEDTVRTLAAYTDLLVLRHPQVGAAHRADAVAGIPVLNAGDGVGEHPTQALLDVYTMRRELQGRHLKDATVTVVGDLLHGRTVHSLCRLLAVVGVKHVHLVAPEGLEMPRDIVTRLGSRCGVTEGAALTSEILADTHVLYVTRVQRERFADPEAYGRTKAAFVVSTETMRHLHPQGVLLHPLPRVVEIDAAVDSDPRAAYFRQVENGMYVRMALLRLCLAE